MNTSHVWLLYLRELRSALRERTIVVNSILMPIFLYPVMLWVMFTGLTFVQGLSEGFTSRVALFGAPPAAHAELVDSLTRGKGFELVDLASIDAAERQLAQGELDAVISFVSEDSDPASNPFGVTVRYDRATDRSRSALSRIESAVDEYRAQWLERQADDLDIAEAERTVFEIREQNVSSERELGAMLLGQMISLFLVIMVALGCFIPSVDTTAGERERSTWETLMTVAASRSSVITAKYLYVATLGILAGLLNVTALMVSIGAIIRPLLGEGDGALSFAIPLAAIPVMAAGAISLALFFAAAMMILASFARSFKDGQAMVQPVYWLVFLPLLLGQQSGVTLSPTVALIPVANVAMMIRDAINGVFIWPLIGLTLAVTLASVVLCLALARVILRFEDYLLGSYDGSFWRFVRERLRPGAGTPSAATSSVSSTAGNL